MKPYSWPILILAVLFSQPLISQETSLKNAIDDQSLYMKVRLDKPAKLSSLKPGDAVEGVLSRDVYSPDGKLFTAGSHVGLTVDHLERRHKAPDDRWPWVVKVFLPRHENFPVFENATVSGRDGVQNLLRISLISAGLKTTAHIQTGTKQKENEPKTQTGDAMLDVRLVPMPVGTSNSPAQGQTRSPIPFVLSLEAHPANGDALAPASPTVSVHAPSTESITLPAGTGCRILLLDNLLSSKNRTGDSFRARLLEPVVLNSNVALPASSLFEGKITKAVPPRWLSRAGSLSLVFNAVSLPDRSRFPVSASVIGVELNHGSHTKIDAEGRLRGEKPGVAWMLINGGVTAGIAKEVDDSAQLVMEAILSGATDASTAGTARIAGIIVSGIFMVTRHGRDVVLPHLTEMDIMLNRPLTLSPSQAASTTAPQALVAHPSPEQ